MSGKYDIIKTVLNLSIAAFLLAMGFFTGSIFSATPSSAAGNIIGYVSIGELLETHPAKKSIEDKLSEFQAKELLKLEPYNREDLTPEERKEKVALQLEINQRIKEKHASLFEPLYEDILLKSKEVGREIRVEVVLDSEIVIYGGIDLTAGVYEKLEKEF